MVVTGVTGHQHNQSKNTTWGKEEEKEMTRFVRNTKLSPL